MTRAELLRRLVDSATPDACALWPGARSNGYPKVMIDGQVVYGHRWAYEKVHGTIPDRHDVHHACHQRSCVNPHHLEAKPRKEHLNHHGLSGKALEHSTRTTCRLGHPLNGQNRWHRYCVPCRRTYQREWARRKAAGRAAA